MEGLLEDQLKSRFLLHFVEGVGGERTFWLKKQEKNVCQQLHHCLYVTLSAKNGIYMSQNKTLSVPSFTHCSPLPREMEREDISFQPLGICQRLFNFISNSIVARSLKCILLGSPKENGLAEIPITDSCGAYSVKDSDSKNSPSSTATHGPPTAASEGCGAIMGGTGPSKDKVVVISQARGAKDTRYLPAQDVGVGQVGLSPSKQIEPAKDQTIGSAVVVPPTATGSEAKGPKKVVSFRDEVEVKVISKEKEKKTSKEKLTKATEPEKGKNQRPLRSILRVASR